MSRVKGVPSKCTGCLLCVSLCSLRSSRGSGSLCQDVVVLSEGFDAPLIDFDSFKESVELGLDGKVLVDACPAGALYVSDE